MTLKLFDINLDTYYVYILNFFDFLLITDSPCSVNRLSIQLYARAQTATDIYDSDISENSILGHTIIN